MWLYTKVGRLCVTFVVSVFVYFTMYYAYISVSKCVVNENEQNKTKTHMLKY